MLAFTFLEVTCYRAVRNWMIRRTERLQCKTEVNQRLLSVIIQQQLIPVTKVLVTAKIMKLEYTAISSNLEPV